MINFSASVALLAFLAAAVSWQRSAATTAATATATTNNGEISASNGNGSFNTFECFFKANCIDGQCAEGTTGVMCEQCLNNQVPYDNFTKYARLGSTCIECELFPWSSISLGAVLVLVILVAVKKGFTQSVATKVKLLVDGLQLVLLTYRIPVLWPKISLRAVSYVSFAYFTPQGIFPACYFNLATTYYVDWIGACVPLILAFILTWIIDRSMRRKQRASILEEDTDRAAKWLSRRTVLRRGFVLLALIYYAPVTSLVLRAYACEGNLATANVWYFEGLVRPNDTNRWLYNYDISCNSGVFQAVTFFGTFVLIFFSVIGPVVLLFFTVRSRRWKLLAKKAALHGSIYESYRANWCFMEAVVLFRKLFMVLVTDIYPLAPILLEIVSLVLSAIYLLLVIFGGPFRQGKWTICGRAISIHSVYEVFSTVFIIGIQVVAVVLTYEVSDSRLSGDAIDYLVLSSLALMVLTWLLMFIGQIWAEDEMEESKVDDLQEAEQEDQPIGTLINQATNLVTRRSGKVADSSATMLNKDHANDKGVQLTDM
eukprot:scpid43483/ scgid15793/ 